MLWSRFDSCDLLYIMLYILYENNLFLFTRINKFFYFVGLRQGTVQEGHHDRVQNCRVEGHNNSSYVEIVRIQYIIEICSYRQ